MRLLEKNHGEARAPHSARCARAAHARLGAAFSLALAGTLALYLCGGSFGLVPALAAEGSGSQGAGGTAASAASGATASAANDTPKEEVVYARLSAGGAVDSVYVVNVLKPTAAGSVTDFGSYNSVQNLTDASGIQQNGDAVTVDVAGDSLSYQGDLGAAALPWDVSVAYELDGKRVDAADLGGASGKLRITIATKKNASVDPAFFDNYLLQITVPFASDQAKDVSTEDGQIALAGSNTQVTFTGMPGKDGTYQVEAQVSDFSFAGVSFAAVPFSMGIETPDTTELVSGFRQLGDGVGQLKTGADGVASGAGSLASGVGQVAGGVNGLASGAGELAGGASGVASGAQGVASGASGLANGLTRYQDGLLAQAQAQRSQAEDIDGLQRELQVAIGAYTLTYQAVYQALVDAQVPPDQARQQALESNEVREAAQAIGAVVGRIGAASGSLGAAEALDGAASGIGSADNADSLLGGASALSAGASELATGANSLASGTSELASGANQAASGAGQLASGASELSSGAQQLASGTGTLYQEVQGMPDKVQQEIDAMMASYDKSDFKPVSFTSSKNTNVTLVQFVMSTDPIEAPTQEEPTVEEPEQGIWDRLLALFGLA
ncbi:hypothetical protein [Gordonibacter massiliensis (ex Traore et al. 2017)]|uniref:hypothetical protein n=1 Tax=Gordonibacter massiliensis (ex Traore et al. 2017) TaxID=1841863 RepID=UPI001C8BBA59|nr:hypothetical protein [Gordonibacter massiliensis (ex Traore et al. 2017)]MBX9032748.1 hypothetical protein [Gordonibacter massiliensis (ex Traore et al. 2017)]